MESSATEWLLKEAGDKEKYMDDTYTSLAQRYDAFHGSMPLNGAQRGKDQIMKMIKPKRGTLFLDMAGGTGDMTVSFLKYQASVNKDKESTAVVFDLNKGMLEVARRRLEDTGWLEQAKVVHGNAEDLSMFGDGSFDIYCCVFGLHNMPNHEKVLKEAFRVIKPGGRLVIGEINTGTRRVARALIRMLFVHVIFPIAYHRLGDSAMTDRLAKSALGFPAPDKFVQAVKNAGFRAEGRGYKTCALGLGAVYFGIKP